MRPLESDVGPALPAPVGTPWSKVRWRTTVGLKVTMGATGVILVTFLVFHLLGNLLVYQGPASLHRRGADAETRRYVADVLALVDRF